MRLFLTLAFLMGAIFGGPTAFSEIESNLPIEHFSMRGVVTRQDPAQKAVKVKTEGGLELTFYVSEATVITQDSETRSLADLASEDEVEIEYDYNANYEKVARLIKKK